MLAAPAPAVPAADVRYAGWAPPARFAGWAVSVAACLAWLLVSPASAAQSEGEAPTAESVTPPQLVTEAPIALPAGTPLAAYDVPVWITIGTDGRVAKVELQAPSGGEAWQVYEQAVLDAVAQWIFEPARFGPRPVEVRVPFTHTFTKPTRRGRMVPARRRGRRDPIPSPGYWLSGEVLEKGTRKPLAGIVITVRDPRTDALSQEVTDADGRFLVYGLPPWAVVVDVEAPDFAGIRSRLRGTALAEGQTEVVDPEPARTFYMKPDTFAGYRTRVREDRPKAAASEISLTEEELTQVPGTFGDPTRVVAALPGVARSPFGLGYYVVRGANFENTGFFIDGHPAFYLYHLAAGPSIIHPELVGQLDFYPGGYPAKFGRFSGGVISLTTKDPPSDRWHLDAELDLFRVALLGSVPFEDGSGGEGQVTISVRQSYYDLLLPLIQEGVDLRYTDYQVRVRYAPVPSVRLRFVALGAQDLVAFAGETGTQNLNADNNIEIGLHRLNLRAEVDFGKDVTWVNSVVWEYDYTSSRAASEGQDAIDIALAGWLLQWRSFTELELGPQFKLDAGVDILHAQLGADLSIPRSSPLGDPRPPTFDPIIVDTSVSGPYTSVAPYISGDLEVLPGLRLLPGFRVNLDIYGDQLWATFDPKLAVRWEFLNGWTLKMAGGMAHQPPPVFQVAPPFGDPDIPPLESVSTSLGLEWAPTDDWEISLEGFFNHVWNYVGPVAGFNTDDEQLNRALFAPNIQGRAYGLEVLVRRKLGGPVHGWVSYTLSRSERLFPGADWTTFSLDQTHVLNLALQVKLPDEWSIGARFTLSTGNPFYPVVGSVYDADRDRHEPVFAEEPERLGVFHRLDLRVDKRFRFDTWMLEVFLDVQNVYNASNPEAVRYSFDFKVQSEGLSVPILPTLGLRAQF